MLNPILSIPFKSLIVALFSVIPPRMWYCFSVTIFLGRSNSKGFHLDWSNIMAINLQVRETIWKFCQPLSISTPIIHFGTGDIRQDEFRDRLNLLCFTLQPTFTNPLTSPCSYFYWAATIFLGRTWNQSQFKTIIN